MTTASMVDTAKASGQVQVFNRVEKVFKNKLDSSGFYCDKLSQANALQSECLLADCANGLSFADNRLGGQHVNSTANININNERRSNVQGETKKQRTLESLRKKRLRRNKKNKQLLSKQERKANRNAMLIGLKNDIQSITEEQKRKQNEVAVWKEKFYQEQKRKQVVYKYVSSAYIWQI